MSGSLGPALLWTKLAVPAPRPGLARPYRMPLWPLAPAVALAGVAVTVWILLEPASGERDVDP